MTLQSQNILVNEFWGVEEGSRARPSTPVSGINNGESLAKLIRALQSSLNFSDPIHNEPAPICSVAEALQAAALAEPSLVNPMLVNSHFGSNSAALRSFENLSISSLGACASLPANTYSEFNDVNRGTLGSSGGSLPKLNQLAIFNSLPSQPQQQQSYQQPPAVSSLLTAADTCLLTSLIALQQRQSINYLQGELLLSSTKPGHNGYNKSYSGPSSLYKTELCRSWQESGSCRYGNKCQFAHGPSELRPIQRHPKYKTEICRTFAQTGCCPYRARCRFIHFCQVSAAPSPTSYVAQNPYLPCIPSALPSPASSASAESFLTSLCTAGSFYSSLALDSPSSSLFSTQLSNGIFVPPLASTGCTESFLGSSSLPSGQGLQQLGKSPSDIGSSDPHRLPIFRTLTDPSLSSKQTFLDVTASLLDDLDAPAAQESPNGFPPPIKPN